MNSHLIGTRSWDEARTLARLIEEKLCVGAKPSVLRENSFAVTIHGTTEYVKRSAELLLQQLRDPVLFEVPFRPIGSTNCIKLLNRTSDGKQLWVGPGDQYYVEDDEGFLTTTTLPFQKPSIRK